MCNVGVIGTDARAYEIAVECANAGVSVTLFDETSATEGRALRNEGLVTVLQKRFRAVRCASTLLHPSYAALVRLRTLAELSSAADCQLFLDALGDDSAARARVFDELERFVSPGILVASVSSSQSVSELLHGRSERFSRQLSVVMFHPPARGARLLEVVPAPELSPTALACISRWAAEALGRHVVIAKDTPYLIARRMAAHALLSAFDEMTRHSLNLRDADLITGRAMARHLGCAEWLDTFGVENLSRVAEGCRKSLQSDAKRDFIVPSQLQWLAHSSGMSRDTEGASQASPAHQPAARANPALDGLLRRLSLVEDPGARVRQLVQEPGTIGLYAWRVVARTLCHAACYAHDLAYSLTDVDAAVKHGLGWELGPFELWDALGFSHTFDRMEASGFELPDAVRRMRLSGAGGFKSLGTDADPTRAEGARDRTVTPRDRAGGTSPVLSNRGAEARDIGDGVLAVRFKTNLNSIDGAVVEMLEATTARAEADFCALVIANTGEHFCVGANLLLLAKWSARKQWDQIRTLVQTFQSASQRLRFARVPVVVAPFGLTIGGGLELCLAASELQPEVETRAGFVEANIGVVPGGGGTQRLLWQALEAIPEGVASSPLPYVRQALVNIARSRVSHNAVEAQRLGFFRRAPTLSVNRLRQLEQAKLRALGLAQAGYRPPIPTAYTLPGEAGAAVLRTEISNWVTNGEATEHDAKIAEKLAFVLCGGRDGARRPVTEEEMLQLEQEAFLSLCGEPKTQERIQHMLAQKVPLRN